MHTCFVFQIALKFQPSAIPSKTLYTVFGSSTLHYVFLRKHRNTGLAGSLFHKRSHTQSSVVRLVEKGGKSAESHDTHTNNYGIACGWFGQQSPELLVVIHELW